MAGWLVGQRRVRTNDDLLMNNVNLYSHEHGGEPERRFRLNGNALVDFSVNVSPLSPLLPEKPLEAFDVNRYPSIDGKGIKEFYTDRFDLDEDTVLSLNGAIEGIYMIARSLKVKRAMVLAPSFFDYERAFRIADARVEYIRLEEQNRFMLPGIDVISEKIRNADVLIAANPNNPTGTRFPKEVFLALASRYPEKWFVMDEAFIQFMDDFPDASLMRDVRALKNIIVVHSLTKFYALPGLRLGAVMAHPDVVGTLLRYKEPWTVNIIAEAVARELLYCRGFEKDVRLLIAEERAKIFKQLKRVSGVSLKGHAANFFLAQWNAGSDLDDLLNYLIGKGVYVRDCRNFPGLEDNYFRFAIRKPEENDYLLELLRKAGEEAGVS